EDFFSVKQWLWADSAYASQIWCVTPFKRLPGGALTRDQKMFNYHLSKVCVWSEHFFSSFKGRFQSLQELQFPIQGKKQLDYSNMWICCCLILHNMIVKIEETLGIASTGTDFYEELTRQRMDLEEGKEEEEEEEKEEEGQGQGDKTYIGTAGQEFCNTLMAHLLCML
ncbi:hypothetical protein BDR04DRAFT_1025256, partial [Suillus decipiens]